MSGWLEPSAGGREEELYPEPDYGLTPAPDTGYVPAPEYSPAPEVGYTAAPDTEFPAADRGTYQAYQDQYYGGYQEPGFEQAPDTGYQAPQPQYYGFADEWGGSDPGQAPTPGYTGFAQPELGYAEAPDTGTPSFVGFTDEWGGYRDPGQFIQFDHGQYDRDLWDNPARMYDNALDGGNPFPGVAKEAPNFLGTDYTAQWDPGARAPDPLVQGFIYGTLDPAGLSEADLIQLVRGLRDIGVDPREFYNWLYTQSQQPAARESWQVATANQNVARDFFTQQAQQTAQERAFDQAAQNWSWGNTLADQNAVAAPSPRQAPQYPEFYGPRSSDPARDQGLREGWAGSAFENLLAAYRSGRGFEAAARQYGLDDFEIREFMQLAADPAYEAELRARFIRQQATPFGREDTRHMPSPLEAGLGALQGFGGAVQLGAGALDDIFGRIPGLREGSQQIYDSFAQLMGLDFEDPLFRAPVQGPFTGATQTGQMAQQQFALAWMANQLTLDAEKEGRRLSTWEAQAAARQWAAENPAKLMALEAVFGATLTDPFANAVGGAFAHGAGAVGRGINRAAHGVQSAPNVPHVTRGATNAANGGLPLAGGAGPLPGGHGAGGAVPPAGGAGHGRPAPALLPDRPGPAAGGGLPGRADIPPVGFDPAEVVRQGFADYRNNQPPYQPRALPREGGAPAPVARPQVADPGPMVSEAPRPFAPSAVPDNFAPGGAATGVYGRIPAPDYGPFRTPEASAVPDNFAPPREGAVGARAQIPAPDYGAPRYPDAPVERAPAGHVPNERYRGNAANYRETLFDSPEQIAAGRRQVERERAAIPEDRRVRDDNAAAQAFEDRFGDAVMDRVSAHDDFVNQAGTALAPEGTAFREGASDRVASAQVRQAREVLRNPDRYTSAQRAEARARLSDVDYRGTEHGPIDYAQSNAVEEPRKIVAWQPPERDYGGQVYRDPERYMSERPAKKPDEVSMAEEEFRVPDREERLHELLGIDPDHARGPEILSAYDQAVARYQQVVKGAEADKFVKAAERLGVWGGDGVKLIEKDGEKSLLVGEWTSGKLAEIDAKIAALDRELKGIGPNFPKTPEGKAQARAARQPLQDERRALIDSKGPAREKRKRIAEQAKLRLEEVKDAARDVNILQGLLERQGRDFPDGRKGVGGALENRGLFDPRDPEDYHHQLDGALPGDVPGLYQDAPSLVGPLRDKAVPATREGGMGVGPKLAENALREKRGERKYTNERPLTPAERARLAETGTSERPGVVNRAREASAERLLELQARRDAGQAGHPAHGSSEEATRAALQMHGINPVEIKATFGPLSERAKTYLRNNAGNFAIAGSATGASYDEDDDTQTKLLKIAASVVGAGALGAGLWARGRYKQGVEADKLYRLPGATQTPVGRKFWRIDTQRGDIAAITGEHARNIVATTKTVVGEFDLMTAAGKATYRKTLKDLTDYINGAGFKEMLDSLTPKALVEDAQVHNVYRQVGADLIRDLPQIVKFDVAKIGGSAELEFQRRFTAHVDEALKAHLGESWTPGIVKAADWLKSKQANLLLKINPRWGLENVRDRGLRQVEAKALGQLGFNKLGKDKQAAWTALGADESGAFGPLWLEGQIAHDVKTGESWLDRHNPVLYVADRNERGGKRDIFRIHHDNYQTTAWARELGLEDSFATRTRALDLKNPFRGQDAPNSLAGLPGGLRERLVGMKSLDEVRAALATDSRVTPAQRKQAVSLFNSIQRDARAYANNEVTGAMRNYARRSNLDTALGVIYPFHYWTTHGVPWVASLSVRYPLAGMAVAAATVYALEQNKDLPVSQKASVRVPLRGILEFARVPEEIIDHVYEAIGAYTGDKSGKQDPRIGLLNWYQPAMTNALSALTDPEKRALLDITSPKNMALFAEQVMGWKGRSVAWTGGEAVLGNRRDEFPEWLQAYLPGAPKYNPGYAGVVGSVARGVAEASGRGELPRAVNKTLYGREFSPGEQQRIDMIYRDLVKEHGGRDDGTLREAAVRRYFAEEAPQAAKYLAGVAPVRQYPEAPTKAPEKAARDARAQAFFQKYPLPKTPEGWSYADGSPETERYWAEHGDQFRFEVEGEGNPAFPGQRYQTKGLVSGAASAGKLEDRAIKGTQQVPDGSALLADQRGTSNIAAQLQAALWQANQGKPSKQQTDQEKQATAYVWDWYFNQPLSPGGPTPAEFQDRWAGGASGELPEDYDPTQGRYSKPAPAMGVGLGAKGAQAAGKTIDTNINQQIIALNDKYQSLKDPKTGKGTKASTEFYNAPLSPGGPTLAEFNARWSANGEAKGTGVLPGGQAWNGASGASQGSSTASSTGGSSPKASGGATSPASGSRTSSAPSPISSRATATGSRPVASPPAAAPSYRGFGGFTPSSAPKGAQGPSRAPEKPLEAGVSAKETAQRFNAYYEKANDAKMREKTSLDEAVAIVAAHERSGGDPAPYVRRAKNLLYAEVRDFRGETRQAGDKQRGEWFGAIKKTAETLDGLKALARLQRQIRGGSQRKAA